ncbi:MAG: transcription antitermination factor NusB [Roseburia sp.]|nr:transcription antitermination factor NusB [Roseburia sp.]MCM1098317.1 transcription antitermination factor NusB [Ruminococcus flavefaciens]
MGRHELREQVFRLLFRVEFHDPEDMTRQIGLFLEDSDANASRKELDYIAERCQAVREKLSEIDPLIDGNTEGWNTARMGKAELAILRLAVYEMRYDSDIPEKVAIDEAVELAKKYGQENSGGFVNAILAKILKLGD